MPRTKLVNGIRIAFTAEEEAQRDAEEAQALVDKQRFSSRRNKHGFVKFI